MPNQTNYPKLSLLEIAYRLCGREPEKYIPDGYTYDERINIQSDLSEEEWEKSNAFLYEVLDKLALDIIIDKYNAHLKTFYGSKHYKPSGDPEYDHKFVVDHANKIRVYKEDYDRYIKKEPEGIKELNNHNYPWQESIKRDHGKVANRKAPSKLTKTGKIKSLKTSIERAAKHLQKKDKVMQLRTNDIANHLNIKCILNDWEKETGHTVTMRTIKDWVRPFANNKKRGRQKH